MFTFVKISCLRLFPQLMRFECVEFMKWCQSRFITFFCKSNILERPMKHILIALNEWPTHYTWFLCIPQYSIWNIFILYLIIVHLQTLYNRSSGLELIEHGHPSDQGMPQMIYQKMHKVLCMTPILVARFTTGLTLLQAHWVFWMQKLSKKCHYTHQNINS